MLHLSMFEDVLSSCSFPTVLEIAKPPGTAATEDFA